MIAVASVHLLVDWSGIELAFDGEGVEFQWIGWSSSSCCFCRVGGRLGSLLISPGFTSTLFCLVWLWFRV